MALSMKLAIVLAAISGQCDECDIASHLVTRTKIQTDIQGFRISEFQGPGQVEISGPPGFGFPHCIWYLKDMEVKGEFDDTNQLDDSGLELASTGFLDSRPFILFLSKSCPFLYENRPFVIRVLAEEIYDSIGVPSGPNGASTLKSWRDQLTEAGGAFPGTDLTSSPQLVFRDGSFGELYTSSFGSVSDVKGVAVDAQSFDKDPLVPTFGAINPSRVGAVIGDPHIQTLSGDHYTLLREGSFLLWQLAMENVQWQIYAHYAGRQSFTKGLLLVDTSGPQPSSMEITSEYCQWQTSSKSTGWSPITSDNEVLLSGPSSRMKLVDHKHEDIQQVELFLSDEKNPVVRLKVMCRPGRHINLKLDMTNKKWASFVTGELIGEKHRNQTSETMMSTLQLVVKDDQEFEVKKPWKELGGSTQAQQYLQNLEQPSQNAGLIQTCDQKAEVEARVICQKHLGTHVSWDSAYFKDCVFDVCSGAREAAEEMAAMLKP